jgi:hypothetical protein
MKVAGVCVSVEPTEWKLFGELAKIEGLGSASASVRVLVHRELLRAHREGIVLPSGQKSNRSKAST